MTYRKNQHRGVSVHEKSNGVLIAEWFDPITRKRTSVALWKLGYQTKTQAEKWLKHKSAEIAAQKRAIENRELRPLVATPWADILKAYREHFAVHHPATSAQDLANTHIRRWEDYLKDSNMESGADLSMRHLMAFTDFLGKTTPPLAPASRNRIMNTVRAMLRWARRGDFVRISSDDIKDGLSAYEVDRREPRVLSRAELTHLINTVVTNDSTENRAPLAPFMCIALLTGARPGEIRNLRWQDVDFDRQEIRIWGSKTRKERVVPCADSPLLMGFFKGLKLRSAGNTYVCGDQVKNRKEGASPSPKANSTAIRKALKRVTGVDDICPKVFRATCVSHVVVGSTYSEGYLTMRFGHSPEVSRNHYRRQVREVDHSKRTIEAWLGIESELRAAMVTLGYLHEVKAAAMA